MNSRYSWKITFGFLLSITTFVLFAIPASSAQNAPPANSQVSQDSQMGPDAQISQSGQMGQEPQMAQDDTADPPSRVARISFLDGTVSIQPGGTGDWGSASINRPVTIGDKLWTDQNSK